MKMGLLIGMMLFLTSLAWGGNETTLSTGQGKTMTAAGYLWSSLDKTFSCIFPTGFSTPEYKSQTVHRADINEDITLAMYMATKNPNVAMISHFKIHHKLRKLKGTDLSILEDAKEGSIQRVSATLISQKKFKIGKYHGLEYTAKAVKEGYSMYIRTKLVVYKDNMINMGMIYVGDANAFHSSEANAFFSSISLK